MPGFDPNDPVHQSLATRLLEELFREQVESGIIEIGNRPPGEILDALVVLMHKFVADVEDMAAQGEDGIHSELDHRDTLLSHAAQEAEHGHDEIAIVFYALWLEHTVNGCLIRGFQRKGFGPETFKPLIRDYNLKTKMTALWHVVGFPPLSDEDIRTADQIAQARNSFVHYKYPGYNESAHSVMRDKLRQIMERSQDLEISFNAAMNALYWDGREDELMNAFQERFGDDVPELRDQRGQVTRLVQDGQNGYITYRSDRYTLTVRFAARASGLAFGLALAVRPAGSAEALAGGGADPDNAWRSGPGRCDISRRSARPWREGDRLAVVLAGAAAGYGGDRRRPVTGMPRAAAAAP